jgi:hypothetical protein
VDLLNPDRWHRAAPYLDQALEIEDEEQRSRWLEALRETDLEIALDLEALLAEHRAAVREGYLERALPAPGRQPPPSPTAAAGEAAGAYTLVSPIGEGGMGAVWLAQRSDGRFERQVAVKFLNLRLGRQGDARFAREGTILGRLHHPHIAELLDAGVTQTGQPYLVLEYVDGVAIDRYCEQNHLGVQARVTLVLDVLDAVAYAHANLVVHRDLKPSNVFVDRDGRVKLLDFGIAKLIEGDDRSDPRLLTHGIAALTPAYAAPEQITGAPITTATDVYALGVLLYVLITGEHPAGMTRPRSTAEMVKSIVDTPPLRLPAGDIGIIIATALKKAPAERYTSATAFASDLRRYLNHEPITARPDSMGYRASRFVRRHRAGVAAAIAALLTLAAALYAVNRERVIAERHFNEVRQLAAKLFEVDVQVRRLPGSSGNTAIAGRHLARLSTATHHRRQYRSGFGARRRHRIHARGACRGRGHLAQSRPDRTSQRPPQRCRGVHRSRAGASAWQPHRAPSLGADRTRPDGGGQPASSR